MEATSSKKTRKRRKRNLSAMIRDYFGEHPDAGPTEVVNAFAERKIKVSPTLVSNVRARMAAKESGVKPAGRGPGRPRKYPAGESVSITALMAAKRMAAELGSIDAAKQALDTLARLQ